MSCVLGWRQLESPQALSELWGVSLTVLYPALVSLLHMQRLNGIPKQSSGALSPDSFVLPLKFQLLLLFSTQ